MQPHIRLVPLLAALATLFGGSLAAHADGQEPRVEIPLEIALSPRLGFDDNDTIEVVLHGKLPNTCYHLDQATSERLADGAIRVRQFATVSNEGLCYDKAGLPPHLKMAAPFTTVLSIGRLSQGEYRFVYDRADGTLAARPIQVEKALVPNVDNLPYAPITSVVARDYLNGSQDVVVTLNGVLNSACGEVDPNVRVMTEGDTFVLLPVIRPAALPPGTSCDAEPRPFSLTVNLGRQHNGHYLIYVRSMAGNALSKVFEVLR